MNRYRTVFFAVCPANDVRVEYHLEIVTGERLMVEDILSAVGAMTRGFHEDFADQLQQQLGGSQVLKAEHHGVEIETVRPSIQQHIKPSESASDGTCGYVAEFYGR